MPGNDLTASRALIPQSTDTRATARANLTTLLTNILDDIEPKVTAAQIDISSDLDFLSGGTRYAAKNLAWTNFEDRTSGAAVSNESSYVKNDELYFKDGSGNEVQLTSGGSAVAGSSGDITGSGYGATGVEINWHAGTAEYRFKSGSGASALADLVADKIRFDDGGATFATLGAPVSMAATLDFLLPGTHPGSTALMTLTSAGAMGHTLTPSVTSLTASGTITATGDMSADEYKITGTKTLHLNGYDWVAQQTGHYDTSGFCNNQVANHANFLNIPLTAGDQITNIVVYGQQNAAGTMTLSLHSIDDTGTPSAAIATDTDTANGSQGSMTLSLLTTTLVNGNSYALKLVSDNPSAALTTGNTYITYDRP